MLAGDHSNGGAIIGGSLKRAGFDAVIRYACGRRGDVDITPQEVADLRANGLAIGIVLEHEADWLLRPLQVAARVQACREITRACGLPDGVTFMAADFDATNGGPTSPGSPGDDNMNVILRSLQIAAEEIGQENVGWYGSIFGIDWLLPRAPWLKWFWQTEAWSQGLVHSRAQLLQRARSVNIAGVDVDLDPILIPEWGARGQIVKPPDPYHYDRFPNDEWNSPFGIIRERDAVLRYDGARKWWKKFGRPHKYLPELRRECGWLADRIAYESIVHHHDWGSDWRWWRYQQLCKRRDGERVA